MKLILAHFSFAMLFLVSIRAEQPLPPDVQLVIDQRASAIAKIDMSYVQKLERLKESYTKQGNLEVANKVVELIQNNQKDTIPKILKGKWIYELDIRGDKRKINREFDLTHMMDENGNRHPYSIKGNIVRIHWGGAQSRYFEDLTIDPINNNVIRGVSGGGTRFTYTRNK